MLSPTMNKEEMFLVVKQISSMEEEILIILHMEGVPCEVIELSVEVEQGVCLLTVLIIFPHRCNKSISFMKKNGKSHNGLY